MPGDGSVYYQLPQMCSFTNKGKSIEVVLLSWNHETNGTGTTGHGGAIDKKKAKLLVRGDPNTYNSISRAATAAHGRLTGANGGKGSFQDGGKMLKLQGMAINTISNLLVNPDGTICKVVGGKVCRIDDVKRDADPIVPAINVDEAKFTMPIDVNTYVVRTEDRPQESVERKKRVSVAMLSNTAPKAVVLEQKDPDVLDYYPRYRDPATGEIKHIQYAFVPMDQFLFHDVASTSGKRRRRTRVPQEDDDDDS